MKAAMLDHTIRSGTWTNDELSMFIDAVKFNRARLGRQVKNQLRVGSYVTYHSPKQGRTVQGEITKIAQKYATVRVNGQLWKVPMNMLALDTQPF